DAERAAEQRIARDLTRHVAAIELQHQAMARDHLQIVWVRQPLLDERELDAGQEFADTIAITRRAAHDGHRDLRPARDLRRERERRFVAAARHVELARADEDAAPLPARHREIPPSDV